MQWPETVLLDTSVLIRFFHDYGDPAQLAAGDLHGAWLDDHVELVLLDLSVYEFVNAVARSLRHDEPTVRDDVDGLFRLGLPLMPIDRHLAREAAVLAVTSGLSAYDAAFVAAGRRLGVPLVTADRRLADRAPDEVLLLQDLAG